MEIIKFVTKERPHWVSGAVETSAGTVPRISPDWSRDDYRGMIKSRVGAFRMHYTVSPELYAVGAPTKDSDVFVTANYKLSFDIVRRSLKGMNAWVLVLDTASINVWCAAGKGAFGTDEVVKRINLVRLSDIVSHRRVILPQLGAVGVSAAAVRKATGFRVSFGPVRARDIPAYVQAGYKKSKAMSAVTFSLLDRFVLTPMELNPAMKKYPLFAAGVLLVFGLEPTGILFHPAWTSGLPFLALGLTSVFAGAFVTPVLLPFVPFRSFAIKGWIVGLLATFLSMKAVGGGAGQSAFLLAASYLLFPALSSYLALQFTGSTTYTGMSGVNKELKLGLPLYIITVVVSLVLVVLFKIREWGLL